jgi:hypothetical protein
MGAGDARSRTNARHAALTFRCYGAMTNGALPPRENDTMPATDYIIQIALVILFCVVVSVIDDKL